MRWRGLLAAALLAGLVAISPALAAAGPEREPRIVGGGVAQPGSYPWAVAIVEAGQPNALEGQFCGGSLIGPQLVLTASHCVTDELPSDFEVVVGRSRLSDADGVRVAVSQYALHPSFVDSESGADAVLLRLAEPVELETVGLATADDAGLFSPGSPSLTIGWGLTKDGGRSGSNNLRQVEVPIVSDEECAAAYRQDGGFFDEATAVCAGAKGRDSCQGDSGGPLVIAVPEGDYRQIGVTSYGRGCGKAGFPGVYADVVALSPFITDPDPSYAPVPSVDQARVEGIPKVGRTLSCEDGDWLGEDIRYRYFWYVAFGRGGALSREPILTLKEGQRGKRVGCIVTASTDGGSIQLDSGSVRVR